MQSTNTDSNPEPPDPSHPFFPGVSEQLMIGSLPAAVGVLRIWTLTKLK